MARIEAYQIIEPPTSEELIVRSLGAILQNSLLELTLLSDAEVPRPKPRLMTVRIGQTLHPEEGGMKMSCQNPDKETVIITVAKNPLDPAWAEVVVK